MDFLGFYEDLDSINILSDPVKIFQDLNATGNPNSVGVHWDFEFIREWRKINRICPKFHFLTKTEIKNDSPFAFRILHAQSPHLGCFSSCTDLLILSYHSSIEGKGNWTKDPVMAILASLDHFYGICGALSWNGWLQSPQSSYLYKLVQLKILNVDKMAFKWC